MTHLDENVEEDAVKVIFLDVDGVLNCKRTNKPGPFTSPIDSSLVANLALIVEHCKAKIVLSTTWRIAKNMLEILYDAFSESGLDSSIIIGSTPHMYDRLRVEEIESWLQSTTLRIRNWVALDDIDLYAQNSKLMKGHFVKTSEDTGLTESCVKYAIDILNKNHSRSSSADSNSEIKFSEFSENSHSDLLPNISDQCEHCEHSQTAKQCDHECQTSSRSNQS